MYSAIVFDVNETLLDLAALDSVFADHFGSAHFRKEWFHEVLKLAFATTIVGKYSDFGVIGKAALEIVEKRHNKLCTEEQRGEILSMIRKLPAHPDVPAGLDALKKCGFPLVALTNSTGPSAEAQLTHAGIRHYFQSVFSADSVKRLKPAWEPYVFAAKNLGAAASSLLMVAAHSWDLAGATAAGWNAAFIARPGQILDALTAKPSLVVPDLGQLASQIIEANRTGRLPRAPRNDWS